MGNAKGTSKEEGELVCFHDGRTSAADNVEPEVEGSRVSGSAVSHFDYNIENHFRTTDEILKLCGGAVGDNIEEDEVERFASNITFLSEWRHFIYEPRTIKFASGYGTNQENINLDEIALPLFSAAVAPQPDKGTAEMTSLKSRKDFVLYVGGLIWALDWCPRPDSPETHAYCEFIALSAHPPDSTYHKIGSPLSGRGMVQIWCLISCSEGKKILQGPTTAPKQKSQMHDGAKEEGGKQKRPIRISKKEEETQPKRPRGKPKNKEEETQPKRPSGSPKNNPMPMVGYACENQYMEALAILQPGDSLNGLPTEEVTSKDAILPRISLCIGHNGEVAWDVKWKPHAFEPKSKHRMGYLAVVLGNGSIEVWEIPSPIMTRVVFCSQNKEGIDPRFLKLNPVFRCSKLKCDDRQSMPLILEWSASPPHDFLLAGCHDGLVALWKFSPTNSSEDTRPLLCFSADTVPIRALAWAPSGGDLESSNVIATAGHEGLKFWDLRDPLKPLWDISHVPRLIYGLDWLPEPRCVITSYDDGTLRILSLAKAAYDVPVTGIAFAGTHQQGLHSLYCSPFAIWSVHVSRLTGMAAYCGADGNTLHFQLTAKAVEKDPHRHRAPHFLCGSLVDEGSTVIVNTPASDDPHPMKSSINEWANAPRSIRGYIYKSNQARRLKNEGSMDKHDTEVLALCYGDEPGTQEVADPKKPTDDQVSAHDDGDSESRGSKTKGEPGDGIEILPSKMVAIHTVRWNMNKGSEQWLCYGGAAGILRCQEIFAPNVKKES